MTVAEGSGWPDDSAGKRVREQALEGNGWPELAVIRPRNEPGAVPAVVSRETRLGVNGRDEQKPSGHNGRVRRPAGDMPAAEWRIEQSSASPDTFAADEMSQKAVNSGRLGRDRASTDGPESLAATTGLRADGPGRDGQTNGESGSTPMQSAGAGNPERGFRADVGAPRDSDAPGPGPGADVSVPAPEPAVVIRATAAQGEPWPRPASCRVMTIANQKGGVGKTTTAVNLAAALALHGSRVLVLDLDPQGNASTALNVGHTSGTPSIYNVLIEDLSLSTIVQPVAELPNVWCAPATIDLAGAEIELVPMVARESRLSRSVAGYDASGLDYILLDCPPSLGLLTVNALVAASEVLIPIQCEYYALEGLEQLLRTVDLVRGHLNDGLELSTILLTMYDARTRLASQVADDVRGHFGDVVLNSVIPRSVRVSEAPSYGQSVITYDGTSSGSLAYLEAAKELAFRNVRPSEPAR
jgi:chromosome partitioning protein